MTGDVAFHLETADELEETRSLALAEESCRLQSHRLHECLPTQRQHERCLNLNLGHYQWGRLTVNRNYCVGCPLNDQHHSRQGLASDN